MPSVCCPLSYKVRRPSNIRERKTKAPGKPTKMGEQLLFEMYKAEKKQADNVVASYYMARPRRREAYPLLHFSISLDPLTKPCS